MNPETRRKNALKELGLKGKCRPFRLKKATKVIQHHKGKTWAKEEGVSRKKEYFSCKAKRRYKSQHEASQTARNIMWTRGDRVRVYFCNICNGWHLTKKELR